MDFLENEAKIFGEVQSELEAKAFEYTKRLEEIAKTVSAEKLFTSVIVSMCIAPKGAISEATHGTVPAQTEMLAYHLYRFFGSSDNKKQLPTHVYFCQEFLDHLLKVNAFPNFDVLEESPAEGLIKTIERQAKVVRGSAYPQQTAQEIIGIQGRFDNWFERKTGIAPSRAQNALFEIFNLHQQFARTHMEQVVEQANKFVKDWKKVKNTKPHRRTDADNIFLSMFGRRERAFNFGFTDTLSNLGYEHYPVDLKNIPNISPALSEAEVQGLIDLIGLTTEKRKEISEIIEIRQHPLYVLPDRRVIVVDLPNALDALWEAFDSVAKADSRFWDGRYSSNKGRWLEDKTVEHLERIFPRSNIFKSLSYPDASKSGNATTELDIAIEWGPFLVLIEAKAKQFRLESQLGDAGRLRTDIKNNVEDAFDQARRASNYVADTATPEFTETDTGRKLVIDKSKVKKTFLLTISLHNLAGLATTLAIFQDIGLFRDGEYPFSASVADLEFITEFCDGPEVFLNYIEKRLEIQKLDIGFWGDELDLLSAYLTTRLQKENLWERGGDKFNAFVLTGWSEIFDRWIWHKQGFISEKPEIFLDVPEEIKIVLKTLNAKNDDQSKWIAFNLLSMTDSVLNAITGLIKQTQSRQLNWGETLQGSMLVDDVLIVGFGGFGIAGNTFVERAKALTKAEMQKRKAGKAIGFAIITNQSTAPLRHVEFLESAL